MPKISVIIPTYNREKLVTLAIDSVLKQAYKDYEIIVIDDGSTDDTKETLKAYGKKITYFYQRNSGVSGALNAGIKVAKGDWVGFLGSDDEWVPEYLTWQMRQVKQYPEVFTHITNSVTVLPNGTKENHFLGTEFLGRFKGNSCIILKRPFYTVIKHSPWFVQSAIIRRDILLDTGLFNKSLTIGEDLDLIARLALKGPFGIISKVLVRIYRREESIENLAAQVVNEGIYSCESFATIFENLRNLEMLTFREKAILAKALSSNRRALANILLISRKQLEARSYYKKALLIYPSHRSLIKYISSFLPYKVAILFIRKGKHIKPGEKGTIASRNN
ncbi:MAG: glycosyltransferase family 2 protein [Candidatus Hodarchaeota archaeon]